MRDAAHIAGLIDHSLLRPDATRADVRRLCEEAVRYGFFSVCVNPCFVSSAAEFLRGAPVRVTTVVGFPLGMTLTDAKVFEAMSAALCGAHELDIVINIGSAKDGLWGDVQRDLSDVIAATPTLLHKAIIETCYLDDGEKAVAASVALRAGAEFVKTSTGFGPGGARAADVRLIKSIVGESAGIKAAGGISSLSRLTEMLDAGATRIGTSSGPAIVEEL